MSEAINDILQTLFSRFANYEGKKLTDEEYTQLKIRTYNETEGKLNENDGYNCKSCRNKGHSLVVGEDGREAYRPCKCQKIRAILRRAKNSGLGDILTDCTFDKFVVTEEWQQVMKSKAQEFIADEAAHWFYVGGQVGSGKSFICTAIAAHYIKAGHDVKYMMWCEDAKRLKAMVTDIHYHDEIEAYKSVDVLYIDDFLKVKNGEAPTAADINLAFEIINHRLMSKNKITIISSEKMLDEIMDYDEATMSRIYQKAGKYKLSIGRDRKRNYRLKELDTL